MLNIILGTKLVKGLVSKFISKTMQRKGYNADVVLNQVDVRETENDKVKIKLDVELECNREDIEKLLKVINEK